MKISEAITFLKQTEKNLEKKSQKKHYNTFIAILTDLQTKELEEQQFLSIEKQLDNLKLSLKFHIENSNVIFLNCNNF